MQRNRRAWYRKRGCNGKSFLLFRFCRIEDLNGEAPEGHPPVKRGRYGQAIIEPGQVWAERSGELWKVLEVEHSQEGPEFVTSYPYGGDASMAKRQTYAAFRHDKRVYEDEIEKRKQVFARFADAGMRSE